MLQDIARLFLFPALVAFAAASDLLTMTISNRVSLLLVAGFLALAAISGMAVNDVLLHLGAGLAVLAIAFACFAFGWIGGGDAKVAAASSVWFGFPFLMNYLAHAAVFGGILTILLILFRRWPIPYALGSQTWLLRLHHRDSGIPYGIALAVGALLVYPETPWIKAVDLGRFIVH